MPALSLDLPRRVEPEMLDRLAVDDPRAQRSRADLKRINKVMATLAIVNGGLDRLPLASAPRTILELGAGDGSLMLRIAKQRKLVWPSVAVTLLDRQESVDPLVLAGIRAMGWHAGVMTIDVDDWLRERISRQWDIVIANLFVHHFDTDALRRLLAGIAQRSRAFFCCEPRRSASALVGSRLVGVLGAGPVTRSDAVASVHAGFRGDELTALWPDRAQWDVREYDAGLFSHCFGAVRRD
ncbi:MAG: hypothetical protein ABIS68_02235 [Casimicrobiaceae bacterium]